ncbi:MAG: hypothetical protein WCE87_01915 [Candidatus Udaeobacter sp.]
MKNQLFTAATIAQALGCSKQNVHQRLGGISPDGMQPTNGNLAKAWRIESLPITIIRQLSEKAEAKRYRTVANLLRSPFERYEPAVPLAEAAPACVERACKLRDALQTLLVLRHDSSISAMELAKRGVEAYKREFGFAISSGHWRTLFNRTIDRDNGAEEWSRLEIYFEENPPRRARRPQVSALAAREHGFEILEDALGGLPNESQLSGEQKRLLWSKICDELHAQIAAGCKTKPTKRHLINVLFKAGRVGTNQAAIAKTLNRKWKLYLANDEKLPKDGRSLRFANHSDSNAIPDSDFRKLVARSLDCGGRVSQAWRELHRAGELSSETCERFISNPICKSHVPAVVRRLVTPEVQRLLPIHHGPREHERRGPYNSRDYSGMFAGDSYQADDVTCPVYYWEPNPTARFGYRILRGQLIGMIDERSRLALGFALHSDKNYNARIIRALITRVHDVYGLPRRRFYFERGIWRTSRILTGGDELAFGHMELGLREFGVKFTHAKPYRARSKGAVERIIGLFQNQMERLLGYAGRDEINDCFERVQEQMRICGRGAEHPSKFFMSKPQWEAELSRIFEVYNSERQEGILKGLSPIEAWNRFQSPEPQVHLGEKARYLLAHHKLTMKVQRSGIVLRPSLGGGTYCSETTGRFAGERVLVWINPEDFSSIALTSLDRKQGPFIVPRLDPLSAIDPSREEFARSASQIDAHNSVAHTSYKLISEHLVRRNFRPLLSIDSSTIALGENIERGAAEIKAQKRALHTNVRKIAKRSRELGMQIPLQRNAKAIDRTAEGADLIAESRRLRESEEQTK